MLPSLSRRLTSRACAPRRRLPTLLAAAVAVTLLLGAACTAPAADGAMNVSGYHGTMLPAPVGKPDVILTRIDGTPYDLRAETEGLLTLLFFGYTNCPDVCPVHMANLATVLGRMSFNQMSRVRVVFVTIDPERDTPDRLGPWLAQFDPRFIALTGDSTALHDVQTAVGVTPAVRDTAAIGTTGYAMAHAAQIYAFTTDGLAHLVYPFGTRQSEWAEDLPRLLEERWDDGAAVAVSGDSRVTPAEAPR